MRGGARDGYERVLGGSGGGSSSGSTQLGRIESCPDRPDAGQPLIPQKRLASLVVLILVGHLAPPGPRQPPRRAARHGCRVSFPPRPSARAVRPRAHYGAMRSGQVFNLRLPPTDIAALAAAAEDRGVSRSELVRRALAEAMPEVDWTFTQDTAEPVAAHHKPRRRHPV